MLAVCSHTPQVVQYDATSVCLRLRTIASKSNFLHLCWHPSSARLNLGEAPQRGSTAEAFSYGAHLPLTEAHYDLGKSFICSEGPSSAKYE